jgi:hypothetical protein
MSAPPSVPITAPIAPATMPPIQIARQVMPIAAPQKAPLTTRVMNCGGTLRLGVLGSWSPTSSSTARAVKIQGVYGRPARPAACPPAAASPDGGPGDGGRGGHGAQAGDDADQSRANR